MSELVISFGAGVSSNLVVSFSGFSIQLVNAKHFWSEGQSSLFDEGHLSKQLAFASSQSAPQKYVASGSVGESTFSVGIGVGETVKGESVGESVFASVVGKSVGEFEIISFPSSTVVSTVGDELYFCNELGFFPPAGLINAASLAGDLDGTMVFSSTENTAPKSTGETVGTSSTGIVGDGVGGLLLSPQSGDQMGLSSQ